MQITLDKHEAELLRQVLGNYLGDWRTEVGKTENRQWRQEMKDDEVVLKALIDRLSGGLDGPAEGSPHDVLSGNVAALTIE